MDTHLLILAIFQFYFVSSSTLTFRCGLTCDCFFSNQRYSVFCYNKIAIDSEVILQTDYLECDGCTCNEVNAFSSEHKRIIVKPCLSEVGPTSGRSTAFSYSGEETEFVDRDMLITAEGTSSRTGEVIEALSSVGGSAWLTTVWSETDTGRSETAPKPSQITYTETLDVIDREDSGQMVGEIQVNTVESSTKPSVVWSERPGPSTETVSTESNQTAIDGGSSSRKTAAIKNFLSGVSIQTSGDVFKPLDSVTGYRAEVPVTTESKQETVGKRAGSSRPFDQTSVMVEDLTSGPGNWLVEFQTGDHTTASTVESEMKEKAAMTVSTFSLNQ